MIRNKKWQGLSALGKMEKSCLEGSTKEEKNAYESIRKYYEWMLKDAKERRKKNPVLEITFDLD